MAYSMDFRLKMLAALDRGESQASVARRFEVSDRTLRRLKKRREADRLEPDKTGPQDPIKLTADDDRVMREQVAARPGITALELQPLLSVKVAECTICRRLIALGLRLKKSR